jgi:uncharacterized integral membrane protein
LEATIRLLELPGQLLNDVTTGLLFLLVKLLFIVQNVEVFAFRIFQGDEVVGKKAVR